MPEAVSTPFWQLAQVWAVIGLVAGGILTTIGVIVNSWIVSRTVERQISAGREQTAAQIDARSMELQAELTHRASEARIDRLIAVRKPYLIELREKLAGLAPYMSELQMNATSIMLNAERAKAEQECIPYQAPWALSVFMPL
ncbi:MAG: hypothetical protein IIC22_08210, partial [Chloroflexi bacterium]|nr:hypothetical protein [Chloroflexota bacterium]